MSGRAPDVRLHLGISVFLCSNMIVKTVHEPFDRQLNPRVRPFLLISFILGFFQPIIIVIFFWTGEITLATGQ